MADGRWRWSPTSATTTPTARATGAGASPRRRPGIVKPGATFVLGETDPELADVFVADAGGGDLARATSTSGASRTALAVGGRLLDLRTPGGALRRGVPPAARRPPGRQRGGARVAAVEAFFGRPLEPDARRARRSAAVTLPGRFEVVQRDPLVILDGAHNPDGAVAAAETLAEEFAVTGVDAPRRSACSTAATRRAARAPRRRGRGRRSSCCTPDSPRALPAARARRARPRALGGRPVVVADVGDGARARAGARPSPTTSCSSPARSTPSAPRAPRAAALGLVSDR